MANLTSLLNNALDGRWERHFNAEIDGIAIFVRNNVSFVVSPRQKRVLNNVKPRHSVKGMYGDCT